MELDYWQNKLDRFTMIEVTSGFKNSQLNDTRLITKYAYHYLKSVFSKVDVQKGSVTADFRKMLGIQSADEKKNRDKHSHHAIDAAILSCIPVAAKRDKMLELFYKIQENKKLNLSTDFEERELERERKSCNIGDITNLNQHIEENILINHVSKDQTLTSAKRKARKRGKEVFVKNEKGELTTKWKQGDSIRGQLHQETFYGKIRIVKRNENHSPLRDSNGKWLFEEGLKEFRYVVRKPIGSVTKLEQIVSPELQKIIQRQLNGRSLEKALLEGVYMLNSKGQAVGNKIRHIRCWADVTNPLPIKKQTYLSDKEYKQDYYAANAENTLYGLYWDGKSKERGYECLNLYQVAQIRKPNNPQTLDEYFPPTKMLGRGKNKINTPLYAILKPDMKVIFYKDSREELLEMTISELSKRLYKMNRIFDSNQGLIQFYHHLEARDDKELMVAYPESEFGKKGKNGFSQFNYEFSWPRLLMSCGSFNFIIEGKDFIIMPSGEIKFLYK
jgi:CRISPR-associated endonuclease Csn1